MRHHTPEMMVLSFTSLEALDLPLGQIAIEITP